MSLPFADAVRAWMTRIALHAALLVRLVAEPVRLGAHAGMHARMARGTRRMLQHSRFMVGGFQFLADRLPAFASFERNTRISHGARAHVHRRV